MISSSLIRAALLEGRISEANEWLGYDYCLSGKVVEGRRLGRELGFPTANIIPADDTKLIPGNGVYAVDVILGTERYKGMLSIGYNPTVNKTPGPRSIEVNIFDFDDNIYGSGIKLVFRYRIRDEIKFADIEALKIQMSHDMEMAYRLLE
jgi:riboflavin kinase/FMN adenylyltransferase